MAKKSNKKRKTRKPPAKPTNGGSGKGIGGDWPEGVDNGHVYKFLTQYWLHQDRLLWSKIQALIVIEAAALAASFAMPARPMGVAALVFGSVLIWIIWQIIQRHRECRDAFLESHLNPVHELRKIGSLSPPRTEPWRMGGGLLRWTVYGVLLINTILVALFLLCLGGSPGIIEFLS